MRLISVALFLSLLLILSVFISAADIIIHDENVIFHSGNEQYNATNMRFSQIFLTDNFIQFNTTRFAITAPNAITFWMHFLNGSITDANISDLLVNFTAETTGGLVYFNFSGYVATSNYTVNRTQTYHQNVTANASGWINWTNELWDTAKNFEIYVRTPITEGVEILIQIARRWGLAAYCAIGSSFIPFWLLLVKRRRKKDEREEDDTTLI